jgi:hypothetical protein
MADDRQQDLDGQRLGSMRTITTAIAAIDAIVARLVKA